MGRDKKPFSLWILPVFGKARSFQVWQGRPWTLHFVLLAAILVGLHFVNRIPVVLSKPVSEHRFVREEYLPILFVLLYVMAWLAWWLWKLLMPEEEGSVFPDIDAAWARRLTPCGRKVWTQPRAPLFLVLASRSARKTPCFIRRNCPQSQRRAAHRSAAARYANADAIYVTCAGASLLGRHVAYLAADPTRSVPRRHDREDGMSEDDAFKTMAAATPKGTRKTCKRSRKAQDQGRDLSELERQEIRRLMGQDRLEQARQIRKSRPSLLKNTVEADELKRPSAAPLPPH